MILTDSRSTQHPTDREGPRVGVTSNQPNLYQTPYHLTDLEYLGVGVSELFEDEVEVTEERYAATPVLVLAEGKCVGADLRVRM